MNGDINAAVIGGIISVLVSLFLLLVYGIVLVWAYVRTRQTSLIVYLIWVVIERILIFAQARAMPMLAGRFALTAETMGLFYTTITLVEALINVGLFTWMVISLVGWGRSQMQRRQI